MGRPRLYLATGLAFLVEWGVLTHVTLLGVHPRLLPALVYLVGVSAGADRGAECGLFAGALCYLTGGTPWQMALFTLLGGISGAVFHRMEGFWGKWLLCLPALAGWEGLQLLGHCLGGVGLTAGLRLAGAEFLLAVVCFPAAALLLRQRRISSRRVGRVRRLRRG